MSNAINLDGGSSTTMWYNGEYVNNSASVIGISGWNHGSLAQPWPASKG